MAENSDSNDELNLSLSPSVGDLSFENPKEETPYTNEPSIVKTEDLFTGITTPLEYLDRCSNLHNLPYDAVLELTDNALFAHSSIIRLDVLPFPAVPKLPPMASEVEEVNFEEEKPQKVEKKRGRKPKKRGFEELEPEGTSVEESYRMLIVQDNGDGMSAPDLQTFLNPVVRPPENGAKPAKGFTLKCALMRLARDALIFTTKDNIRTVGLLSRSFMQYTSSSEVPIASWQELEDPSDEMKPFLESIQAFTPFNTLSLIQEQFEAIGATGTRIILFNLKRFQPRKLELDFNRPNDILYRDKQRSITREPELYSLRYILSICYESPRFKIYLREKKILFQKVAENLYRPKVDWYKPFFISPDVPMDSRGVKVIFGINTSNKDLCGLLVYRRKRLVLKYHHLQKIHLENKSSKYMGVVCLLDVPYLELTPSKSDFIKEGKAGEEFDHLMAWMSTQIKRYWKSCKIDTMDGGKGIGHFWAKKRKPGDLWVQCDRIHCLKWRRLPYKAAQNLKDDWKCDRCEEEEEVPSYSMIESSHRRKLSKGTEKEKEKERERDRERKKRGRKPKPILFSPNYSIDINEARFVVLKDDIRSIENHLPLFALSPDWQEERLSMHKRLQDCVSPKDLPRVLECLSQLRESIISDFVRPSWDELDWIDRMANCTNVESAQELVNDIDYLCIDWDKIGATEMGVVKGSEGEDTEGEDLPSIMESASPFPVVKRQRTSLGSHSSRDHIYAYDDAQDTDAEEYWNREELPKKEDLHVEELKRKHRVQVAKLKARIEALEEKIQANDQSRKGRPKVNPVPLHFEPTKDIPRIGPSFGIFQSLRDRMIQDGAEKRPQYFIDPFLGISSEKELVAKTGSSLLSYFQAFNSFFPHSEIRPDADDLQNLF